jgi:sodium/hydrogen exchanger 8
MVLLVGIVAGFFLSLFVDDNIENDDDAAENVAESLLSFSPKIFFLALLPPIIFNSGYHLRREMFLRHLTPICLLAFIGTFVSTLVIAFLLYWVSHAGWTDGFEPTLTELLTFGALISATDPVSTLAVFQSKRVDPHLFYLVFGESVMNDAVGLVLFNAFAKFVSHHNTAGKVTLGILEFCVIFIMNFAGSLVLGIISGILAAMLLKYVDMRQNTLLELTLYIMIMYVPFLLAEILQLSGIVTILFSGIAARRYVVPNLSESTDEHADVFFRLAAHIAETSIFLELGLSVAGLSGRGLFDWAFIMWSLLACLVGRALNVYPICVAYNVSLRKPVPSMHDETTDPTTSYQADDDDGHSHVEMTDQTCIKDDASTDSSSPEKSSMPQRPEMAATLTLDSRKDQKIQTSTANMLWFSGLRGAVAYACAKTFPDTFGHQKEFMATTMALVLITVFVFGGTTELMLNVLKIQVNVDEDSYIENYLHADPLTGFIHNLENVYVYPCVVRHSDMADVQQEEPIDDDESVHSFHEHVDFEMTESQHETNVARRSKKLRESLYDFGSA